MSLSRMFHVVCDVPNHDIYLGGSEDLGDEWYAQVAISRAKADGWHISGKLAICAGCWDQNGARFSDLTSHQ